MALLAVHGGELLLRASANFAESPSVARNSSASADTAETSPSKAKPAALTAPRNIDNQENHNVGGKLLWRYESQPEQRQLGYNSVQ